MGGDNKSKLLAEVKKSLLQLVDTDCTKTLKELEEWVQNEHMIEVSLSTIDRELRKYHYTLKNLKVVLEKKTVKIQKRRKKNMPKILDHEELTKIFFLIFRNIFKIF